MKRASAYPQMPSLTYTPGRFGQWITYQDNKTIQEMLFSGEAREAYLDSFLSGFALGFPSAGIDTVLLENRGYSGKAADAALDIPAPAAPVGALADGGLRGVKALSDGKTPDVSTAAADGGARAAEILKNQAQTPSAPRAQLNGNVRAQTSLTPQLQADMQASDRAADTVSNSADAQTDIRTDTEAVPVRNEDALRDYLESGLDSAAEPDVGRSPSSVVDTLQSAELNSDLVLSQDAAPETTQEAIPKTKEQLISELAPKIQKTGITPGRATIEAQRLYADAERIFGSNADTVLEMFQPGQDPRKFLDGFRNAYLSGKMGSRAALENSTAAAYLSDSQRELAFELGERAGQGLEKGRNDVRITLGEAVAADNKPYAIPLNREVKKAIIQRGINAKTTIFAKDTAKNPLATYAQRIPKKDGFYDVVMHGADTAVWFFDTKIDAYTLSQIIRQRPDYKKGTAIRLLSCNTGNTENTGDCVAQLLANELEVTVIAPNLKLYVYPDGTYTVGRKNQGEMEEFFSRKVDKYSEVYYGY